MVKYEVVAIDLPTGSLVVEHTCNVAVDALKIAKMAQRIYDDSRAKYGIGRRDNVFVVREVDA